MSGTQNVTLQLDGPCLKGAERRQLQFKNLNFQIYLQLPPGGKHFPPHGHAKCCAGEKAESALLSERKFAARSSSPQSLRGLPSFCGACCVAQVRTRDDGNGPVKRHSLINDRRVDQSFHLGLCQGYSLYIRLPEDQVHTVSPWQTGNVY